VESKLGPLGTSATEWPILPAPGEHPFTGPEPACGISIGVAKKAVRDWMKGNHKKILGIHNWTQTGKGTYILSFKILADNIPPIEEATERKPYGLRIF
jgi:hypothetical protein